MVRSKVHESALAVGQVGDGLIDEPHALCGHFEHVLAFVAEHEIGATFHVLRAEGVERCAHFGLDDDLFHGAREGSE